MVEQRIAPYAAPLLRVTISGLFMAALYGKFILRPISLWWNGLLKAGYPEWVLAYTLSAEFAAAILLTLGIYTRWVSLYSLPLMIGATHFRMVRKSFWFTEDAGKCRSFWAVMLLVQALLGDGAFKVKVPSCHKSAVSNEQREPTCVDRLQQADQACDHTTVFTWR